MAFAALKSYWSSGSLIFQKLTSGAAIGIEFGIDGTGIDVTFRGDTASAYMMWDQSADSLVFAGGAKLAVGSSGTPLTHTAGTPNNAFYYTCSSTSGSISAEPFYVKTVMTGAAGVGGRAKFYMTANVALGGWSNALKAQVDYGATGSTSGIGSAFCAELNLSAGTTAGTYAPLESEIVLATGAKTGTATSFMYMAVTGDAASEFDTNGFLFELSGVTANTGKLWSEAASAATGDSTLRIRINGVSKYLLVADDAS